MPGRTAGTAGTGTDPVWDHRPTADELLDARVQRGWRPTPTELRDGPQVLGHACKLTRR